MNMTKEHPASGSRRSTNQHEGRKGGVIVVVLAALVIVSTLWVAWTQRTMSDRRQIREVVLQRQTERLAEAGVLMARQAIQKDAAWTGTQVVVPAGVIHKTNSGELAISVQNGLITVVAKYPSQEEIPYKVTRTGTVAP
ncbi:MAG: hypothetical protein JNM43_22600 [Planctomycetaceae bacterium]|nr:hypothetical protein [Planctomycetaceae bacterium]